jgi:hypothetical protein
MISQWFDQKLGLALTMPTMMTDKVTIMAMAILMAICRLSLDSCLILHFSPPSLSHPKP